MKIYEKPLAQVIFFHTMEAIMDLDIGEDPEIYTSVEEW